jgi:hypothetical protein
LEGLKRPNLPYIVFRVPAGEEDGGGGRKVVEGISVGSIKIGVEGGEDFIGKMGNCGPAV